MLMIQRKEPKTKQSKTVHLILQILHKKTHTHAHMYRRHRGFDK